MRFADIIGRGQVKSLLTGQVDSGKLPHALLLWGPEGVGKLALARALVQYVHCPNRSHGDSCGVCPVCRQHASLNYPDVLYAFPVPGGKGGKGLSDDYMQSWYAYLRDYPLAPWQNWLEICGAENSQPIIRVDESSEILRRLNLGNYGESTKILLLWLPEKLNPAAANKLLKLIEEPQPGRMFIMVSNNPSAILPTVYSRLQRVKVESPSVEETMQWLTAQGIAPEDARQAAAVAGGNQLKALQMLDAQGEEAEFRELFHEVMRKAYVRDVSGLRRWSEKAAALKREKTRRFLTYLASQLRQNFLFALGNDAITPMMEIDRQFSSRFSPFVHGANIEELMRCCDEAIRDIAGNANAKIVLFDFALQMIMLIKTAAPK